MLILKEMPADNERPYMTDAASKVYIPPTHYSTRGTEESAAVVTLASVKHATGLSMAQLRNLKTVSSTMAGVRTTGSTAADRVVCYDLDLVIAWLSRTLIRFSPSAQKQLVDYSRPLISTNT